MNKRTKSSVKHGSAKLHTLAMILLLSACSGTEDSGGWSPGPAPEGGWSVSTLFEKAESDGYSGTVLVRHRGEIVLNSAAGFSNREAQTEFTTSTVMTMGSITKPFTAAVILALQERGLLSAEDQLSDHFSDVPDDYSDITIHQLLTHTSGLVEGVGYDHDPIGREDFLALVWSTPLLSEPGTGFSYSNTGYSVITAIIEKATGLSYETALREYLLSPAGIAETGYLLPDWSGSSIAVGYFGSQAYDLLGIPWAQDGPYWNLRGNGGLLTTSSDLLKWHDVLSTTDVLDASSIDAMHAQYIYSGLGSSFYGYGWFTEDTPVGKLHWHDGTNGFHYAQILRFAEEDLVIIVLSNEDRDVAVRLSWHMARAAVPSLVGWSTPDGF